MTFSCCSYCVTFVLLRQRLLAACRPDMEKAPAWGGRRPPSLSVAALPGVVIQHPRGCFEFSLRIEPRFHCDRSVQEA